MHQLALCSPLYSLFSEPVPEGPGLLPAAMHCQAAAARNHRAFHCSPLVRKLRILGSLLSARSLLGFPTAIIVLVSPSRKTELFPMAKMLANSWLTTTTV